MKTLHFNNSAFRKSIAMLLCLSILGTAVSCRTWSRQSKGAVIGAGTGAAAGGLIGRYSGRTAVGALIGAAVGGAAGALIGRYMDKQAAELKKDLPNATVERVGEGIKVTFKSGILFAYDSDKLTPQVKTNLDEMSQTLNKYADTQILIEGHTDNSGADAYNQKLSERRAASVLKYLRQHDVTSTRMQAGGFGEQKPVADNTSTEGREKNRRVEVAILANEQLRKAAEKGDLPGL